MGADALRAARNALGLKRRLDLLAAEFPRSKTLSVSGEIAIDFARVIKGRIRIEGGLQLSYRGATALRSPRFKMLAQFFERPHF